MIIEKFEQAGIEVSAIRASIATDESYRYFDLLLLKGIILLKLGSINRYE